LFSIFKEFASKGFLGFAGNYVQNIIKFLGRTNEIRFFELIILKNEIVQGRVIKKLKIGAGRDHLIS
jgi:hypothetical protein